MNPKQKCDELIELFIHFAHATNYRTGGNDPRIENKNAKECALACVDEIIDAIDKMEDPTQFINGEWNSAITLWVEVKREIEKL